MNATARIVAATVMAGAILAAFGVSYSSIINRIDLLNRQVETMNGRIIQVLDDHDKRLRIVEVRAAQNSERRN